MPKARTCAITINYKGADDTAACVASLSQSTVPVSIVVVDNTPNDPDLEKALLPFLDDIKLIRAPENLGFGRGNNLGIDWALANTDCEFILIFNNDALVYPDTIARMEEAMDRHPEAAIVAPRILYKERPDLLWYGGGEVSWLRGAAKAPGILGPSDAPLAMQERKVTFASGCAMLLRRNVLQKLQGFDERFFMYEEDLELCLRVLEHGWKIHYLPAALVLHAVQASTRGEERFISMFASRNKNLSFYVYHLVRNRLINMRLHAKRVNKLIFVAGFGLMLIKHGLSWVLSGRWDGFAALFRAWRSYRACFRSGKSC